MRNILIILIMFSLFLPHIEGINANIAKTDFNTEMRQAFKLGEGDGISFIKDQKEYVISVDEIGKGNIRLKSFGYKEDGTRETFYFFLSEKYTNKIDFEKDNLYDMKVELVRIRDNGTSVDLLFEALNEPKTTQETSSKSLINSQTKTGLIIAGSIIIIGLLIYFLIKKK